MKNLAFNISLVWSAAIVFCTIAKSVYFKNAGRSSIEDFAQSFFKWYSSYRMYDTSSEHKRLYMKANNRLNLAWWIFLMLALAFFTFSRLVQK